MTVEKRGRRRWAGFLGAGILWLLTGCAAVQDQDQGAATRIEDMVVKAPALFPRDLILPESLRVLDREIILDRAVSTTPDALEEEVGVVIQKTGPGGGSPIIRGRTGKEVLELIDGQRFNNAIFRRNNQYLNTIDLNAIERIEVIRGPVSVAYGSDAMGGSVNVITRRREPTGEDGLSGRLYQQVKSADRSIMSHIGVEGEYGGYGFTSGFTYKSFDDLRAGNHGNPAGAVDTNGRQVPTAYRETDLSFSLIKQLSEKNAFDLLVLESRQEEVPRSDRLIPNDKQPDPPDLRNDYDPQVLRWYELRFRHEDPGEILESLTLAASLNNPREGRKRIKASDPGTLIEEEDEVTAPGFSGRVGLRPHLDHLVTTGIEGYFETVESSGKTTDLATGAVTPEAFGRYPDDAAYRSLGVYVQDEWEVNEELRWTNGVRYSAFRVKFDLEGLTVGPLPPFGRLSETYDDVTFSTSLAGDVGEKTTLYGSISRGFRTPNLDDLAAVGDFASGNRVPNLDLDPEKVLNLEIGARHRDESLKAGASGAVAFFEDILDNRFAFTFNGEDYFQVDNVSRAVVYSAESWIEAVVRPSDGSSPAQVVFAQASLNIGRNRSDREPLSKVPPPEGALGYRLEESDGAWFAEAFLRGALEQNRLSSSDEADPRFPADGTPGWWTFNLRGGLDIAEGMRLTAALENIFDQRYRIHGSGIDAPGVNAVLALDIRF